MLPPHRPAYGPAVGKSGMTIVNPSLDRNCLDSRCSICKPPMIFLPVDMRTHSRRTRCPLPTIAMAGDSIHGTSAAGGWLRVPVFEYRGAFVAINRRGTTRAYEALPDTC